MVSAGRGFCFGCVCSIVYPYLICRMMQLSQSRMRCTDPGTHLFTFANCRYCLSFDKYDWISYFHA